MTATIHPAPATTHPATAVLPCNMLRWHVAFQGSASRDGWPGAVRLIDAVGNEVPGAFLELPEGIWDPTGRILTVLMHPGRVKRRVGGSSDAVLRVGAHYHFEVDLEGFGVAYGPGLRTVRSTFTAGPRRNQRLDPGRWTVGEPIGGTTKGLRIRSSGVVDWLSAQHYLHMLGPDDHPLVGEFVEPPGGGLEFVPREPWRAEMDVRLGWGPRLEDVCGNRPETAFEAPYADRGVFP
ncbi:MAG: hypothetical protein AAGF12_24780 [Myxococcota bacterium]